MTKDTSLTEEVTAGRSMTEAVRVAAGRRSWRADEILRTESDMEWGDVSSPRRRHYRFVGKMTLLCALMLAALVAASMPIHLDTQGRSPAAVHGRVALVVGNSAYLHTLKLENPRNDAADIATALRRLGFHVVEGFDLDKAAFDAKIDEFTGALHGGAVGLFFYAGHGIQVSGQNYLVPVDARLAAASSLELEMVPLERVHRAMERAVRTSLLFFDACRDNPLTRNLASALGTRSAEIGRGLAAVESGAGTLISYSTQPGNVALDGHGRNSPYSGALVKQLAASRDDLSAILIAVRNDVMRETDRKQVPWEHSALTGRFYFHPAQVAAQLREREATSNSPR